jgi:NAD(P)-dependent dehydrogenase (short-subunit alcohol dehydrogenase family)
VIANGAPPRALLPVVCDVAKDSEARSLLQLAQRAFGEAPTILVNCAGVSKPNASLMDGDSAAWVEMLSTNVLAAAMCGREACRAMAASGQWGHIVTVSSLSGAHPPHLHTETFDPTALTVASMPC